MNGCKKEKEGKVSVISLSDAGTHPRTVVIMNFNACATLATVEGPGWS